LGRRARQDVLLLLHSDPDLRIVPSTPALCNLETS
jgi:hypothetical protein